ncbi:MAG: ammonium transporter [Anaerolineae bacterium]|nr:ammonium transporter [Anaerolineae bacterium]
MFKATRRLSIPLLLLLLLLLTTTMASAQGEEPPTVTDLMAAINTGWVLMAAFLVFFMQAGFGFLEAGFVRSKNVVNIMAENFMDTTMTTIGYFIAGFAIMFGVGNAFFGQEWFFLRGIPAEIAGVSALAFFFFQFCFSAAASTIASGLMAERTSFRADLVYSFIVGLFIYPLIGHWIWGPGGWLAQLGMLDFAGSTVVHLTGALIGLAGTLLMGPRKDKEFGNAHKQIRGHNIPLAALGTFVLWFGWFGFNPGSALGISDFQLVSMIVVNTDFAATTGAITAMFLAYLYTKKWDASMAFNGALGGLVAITAGCAFVTPYASLTIGVVAGVLTFYGVELMERLRIDDPVGAFPVHGICGIFGTLAVGLWAVEGGLLHGGGVTLLGAQAVGVLAAIGFVFPVSLLMFFIISKTIGLRVREDAEAIGLDLTYHGIESYPEFAGVELHGVRIAEYTGPAGIKPAPVPSA